MPSPEEVYADIEADRLSREGEVRLIERLLHSAKTDGERSMLKRSIVLLTYAHLEGFCRFALLAYVSALNALGLKCSEATFPIVAATLSAVFTALRDPNRKHEAFKHSLPEDARLHLAAREQAFVEGYEDIVSRRVEIPDQVVDTRYNVSATVLKKMLFQLGLPYPEVDAHQTEMNNLLAIRNAIAHGDRLKIPSDSEIGSYLNTAIKVMGFLQTEVYVALKTQGYLRPKNFD